MSYHLRRQLAATFLNALANKSLRSGSNDTTGKLARLILPCKSTRNFDKKSYQFTVYERQLSVVLNTENDEVVKDFTDKKFEGDGLIENVRKEKRDLVFKVNNVQFTKSILGDIRKFGTEYGHGYDTNRYVRTNDKDSGYVTERSPETVLVEYGSPNVAKPLHAGHLRSAIIGQFTANINQVLGNQVIRMNYLGDWGTQFGLLAVGFQKFGNTEKLKDNALDHLLDVYVKINDVVETEGLDGETYRDALKFMSNLENGDVSATEIWRHFRNSSVESSLSVFDRLGVKFDQVEFESDYVNKSKQLCNELEKQGFLKYDDRNVGFIDDNETKIILKKSDNTSLYLSRDLAAILNRMDVYKFDRLHYVVDNGQAAHFKKMKRVLELLQKDKLTKQKTFHLAFGRIRGMSTRKGNVIHLNNVLDEAKHRMLEIVSEKETTKTDNLDYVAEILGRSAVFIQDLKEKRQKDYDFDWNRMLSNKGATGPFLQYGHARLCSIEDHFYHFLDRDVKYEHLQENEALRVLQHLSRFDQILSECYTTLEPHTLVHYLLDLVTLSNQALVHLNIKNSPDDLACARTNLFHCTRLVLSNGMRILGIEPLREM